LLPILLIWLHSPRRCKIAHFSGRSMRVYQYSTKGMVESSRRPAAAGLLKFCDKREEFELTGCRGSALTQLLSSGELRMRIPTMYPAAARFPGIPGSRAYTCYQGLRTLLLRRGCIGVTPNIILQDVSFRRASNVLDTSGSTSIHVQVGMPHHGVAKQADRWAALRRHRLLSCSSQNCAGSIPLS